MSTPPSTSPSPVSPFSTSPSPTNPSSQKRGSIKLIHGPMFSGKTTELLREVERCNFSMGKRTCALIKFSGDTRYSTSEVATHSSRRANATLSDSKLSHLEVDQYDVIAIDEGQFFPDLVEFCLRQKRRGASIIVAALNGTADQTPFPCIAALIPHLSSSILLTSVCGKCGHDDAIYSVRTDNRVSLGDQPDVGGQDKYVAMCDECLLRSAA